MMKHEFERMAGREVTTEQYDAFETLYMNSNLNQQDFVKSIKQILKAIPQPKKGTIRIRCVRHSGETFNHRRESNHQHDAVAEILTEMYCNTGLS